MLALIILEENAQVRLYFYDINVGVGCEIYELYQTFDLTIVTNLSTSHNTYIQHEKSLMQLNVFQNRKSSKQHDACQVMWWGV